MQPRPFTAGISTGLVPARRIPSRRTARSWLAPLVALLVLACPVPNRAAMQDIYPAPEQAAPDLQAAIASAAATHRRVIVDFGGNWCPDCHALDLYFHDAANRPLLEANYILVHVNIGRWDRNADIAERYGIPLHKGVPALAVLDTDGKLLYGQKAGEFGDMRHMQSAAVTEFLMQWKPAPIPH